MNNVCHALPLKAKVIVKFNKNCHEKKYFFNQTFSICLTLTHNTSQAKAKTVCLQK